MILLRERYRWKPEDSKTDVKFSFVCPGEVTGIRILFSFDPDALEDPEACRPMIEKAIRQYYDNRPLEWDRIRPESIGAFKKSDYHFPVKGRGVSGKCPSLAEKPGA